MGEDSALGLLPPRAMFVLVAVPRGNPEEIPYSPHPKCSEGTGKPSRDTETSHESPWPEGTAFQKAWQASTGVGINQLTRENQCWGLPFTL